jgi:hypothetical protein
MDFCIELILLGKKLSRIFAIRLGSKRMKETVVTEFNYEI